MIMVSASSAFLNVLCAKITIVVRNVRRICLMIRQVINALRSAKVDFISKIEAKNAQSVTRVA